MQLAVMYPADRHNELVTHSASECARLCEGEVMRIRGHATAHEARLSQYKPSMVFVAQANRFAQGLDGQVRRPLTRYSRRPPSEWGDPNARGRMALRRSITRQAVLGRLNLGKPLLKALLH